MLATLALLLVASAPEAHASTRPGLLAGLPPPVSAAATAPAARAQATPTDTPPAPSAPRTEAAAPSTPRTSAAPGAGVSLGVTAWIIPTLLLGLLSAAAGILMRHRPRLAGGLRVVESTSLGPKRSITVVRAGDSLLVLGVSEAGITLLEKLPAPADAEPAEVPSVVVRADAPVLRAVPRPSPADDAPAAHPVAASSPTGTHRATTARPDPFAELLVESAEDQELRRKLARGMSGSVR